MAIKKKQQRKQSKRKKVVGKKAKPARKLAGRKRVGKTPLKKKSRKRNQTTTTAHLPKVLGVRSGSQSGDLQGLSGRGGVGSESVDELLEEGNAFEAGIVKAVDEAPEESEVVTHEVPEDDVPDEYLDKDR